MNDTEFAKMCDEYRQGRAYLEILESQIKAETIARQASQEMSGLRVTFYKETEDVDYEAAAMSAHPDEFLIARHSTTVIKTRWKEVAEAVGVDLSEYKKTVPAKAIIK